MTQRVVPFLHTPLEAPEFLDLWRSTLRQGVVRANEATAGSTGWKVTVRAGESIIDGSWVYDDLDKIDGLDLGHVAGADRHYIVYQTYTYAGSDPPATSVFAVTAGVAPPTQPTIPANSVKLCDIFVPAGALSIGTVPGINQQDAVQVSSTGVRFVQAPRLWPREDTGELMDKLVMAGTNTMAYTQGSITYDDATGNLVFSQPVVVQSLCTTYRQAFNNAPSVVRSTLAAGTYVAPGTPGSRDVVVYMLLDRSSPTTALVGTLKFLNRNAPALAELNELMSYANRTQIVILGVISGAKLFIPGVQGGLLPLAVADERRFLQDRASGVHSWELVEDTDIIGGLRANFADATARDAIPADVRRQGMLVYVVADDAYYTLRGGILNANWVRVSSDAFISGGMRVVADQAERLAIPQSKQITNMLVMQADNYSVYQLKAAPAPAPTNVGDWNRVFQVGGANEVSGALSFLTEIGNDPNDPMSTANMAAIGMAARIAGHPDDDPTGFKSHVANGLELLPAVDSNKPRATLKSGSLLLPNGLSVHSGGDVHLDLGVSGSFVGGALPTYPSNVFIFVRRKAGDVAVVLRASVNPPESSGALNAADTPDATYIRNDYAYVGMLRPSAATGATYFACWGRFMVSHLGNGDRLIKLGDATGLALTSSNTQAALADTDDHTAALSPGGVSAAAFFPTASEVEVRLGVSVSATAGGGKRLNGLMQTEYGGIAVEGVEDASLAYTLSKETTVVAPVMSTQSNVYMLMSIASAGGTRSMTASITYNSVKENVNRPIERRQTAYGHLP